MSSGSVGRMASSAVVPAEAMDLSTGGDSSARPKVNQLRCSQISATSGHLVIDMGPTGTDDGGGGSTRPPIDVIRRPGVHLVLAFDDLTYSVKQPKSWFFHQSGRRPIDEMASGERAGRNNNNNNNNNGNTRTLLDGISGEAREGEILAVLGASGSGKSTLIDALAGRIQRSSLHGSVTLNGEPLDSNLLKVISAHVMQDDLLYPMLTVEETLTYSAELRLPRATPGSTKRARVQALIDQLGLRAAAHTIIGDEGRRGVSGGERRRVSIGVDVVHDPVVLFLDEPTSGLDSTSAFMVAKALRTIARSGSVVVMSIHQPSYRIVSLLDSLLFLSQGQTVYYGPPAGLPPFFSELDLGHTMIDGENPAEFALDTIRDLEGTPEDGTQKLVDLSKSWWQQKKAASVEELSPLSLSDAIGLSIARGKLVSSGTTGGDATNKNKVQLVSSYANPWWAEVCVLTRRALTNTWRTPELFLIRLAAVVATGLILATVFWRLDNTPKGVTERFGFFAISIATMFYASSDALPVFVADRYIFLRETAHNAYRRSSYALSNALAAFPPLLLLSLAFTAIVFPAVGLAGGAQGCAFFALVVLASFWAGSGFVTFLSAVVPHVIIGYTVVVAVLAYFLLFSGFLITRDRIQGYWIWFHYLSLIKYPYQAVMHNEFGADPAKCFMRGVQMFDGTPIGKMPEATKVNVLNAMSRSLRIDFNSTSCINTGADILAKQAVTDLGKWACVWVTVAWGFLFRVFFYIALLLGSKNKRA